MKEIQRMRKLVFVALVVVLTLSLAPAVWAADDGNTQPKLGYAYVTTRTPRSMRLRRPAAPET
jgi:hypothetical protein